MGGDRAAVSDCEPGRTSGVGCRQRNGVRASVLLKLLVANIGVVVPGERVKGGIPCEPRSVKVDKGADVVIGQIAFGEVRVPTTLKNNLGLKCWTPPFPKIWNYDRSRWSVCQRLESRTVDGVGGRRTK